MSKQKNSKKIFATSVTAAVVATVVTPLASLAATTFPDVPANHNYAGVIKDLVDAGVVKGFPNGEFKPEAQVTRAEAAVMMASILDLEKGAEATPFKDVEAGLWYTEAINALYKTGYIKGLDDTTFAPDKTMTRAEFSQLVYVAYGIQKSTEEAPFGDLKADWYKEPINALYANGLIKGVDGKNFAPQNNIKRGDFAWLLANTDYQFGKKLPKPVGIVGSVTATNATTLSVTGTNLKSLKAGDITVEGNTVSSITVANDGKTATIVLGTILAPNVGYTVKVQDKEYRVTYSLVADKAAITEATYDDARANQFVAFTVNGVTANVPDLLANGYTVKFTATDKDATTDETSTLFANTTTGELKTGLTIGKEYKVQVTLTNGTNVIVAPAGNVKIANLDLAATAINSYELVNASTVVQNSSNLVVGEKASIKNLKVLIDGKEEKIAAATKVESSNKSVASIDAAGVITAHTPGTTTLTVSYGNVKKAVTLTVVNDAREVSSIKVTKVGSDSKINNATVIKSATPTDYDVQPLDQYGDPVTVGVVNVETADATIATAPATLTAAADGKVTLSVSTLKAGNTTLLFKHATKNTTVGTFGVTITENAGVASKKWEIVAPKSTDPVTKSADNTLDLSDDKFVEYKFNKYNSEGVKNGSVALSAVGDLHTATSSDTSVATAAIATDVLTITGVKKGTATISVKDSLNVNVGTITVTVTDTGATITGVTFKPQTTTLNYAKTVDYKTFLSYTEPAAGKDPVITGITLSKSTNNAIRLNTAASKLYIDTNGDAIYTSGTDADLGEIALTATTDSTGGLAATAGVATVAAGNKGTLIFTVKEIGKPKVYASTSLDVDVK